MISRRRTRELLLQALYARTEMKGLYDAHTFLATYMRDEESYVDEVYFTSVEASILAHQSELLAMVAALAPKFELQTMPVLHILILSIALSEMLYFREDPIPDAVSVNEAIELAKKFSDDHGKSFINGALSTFMKDRESIIKKEPITDFILFS